MRKTPSRKSAGRAAIEWRLAPSRVNLQTLPIDRRWTLHSWAPRDVAGPRSLVLGLSQSENGVFQFRVRP